MVSYLKFALVKKETKLKILRNMGFRFSTSLFTVQEPHLQFENSNHILVFEEILYKKVELIL